MLLNEQCLLGIEGTGQAVSVGIMLKGLARGCLFLDTGKPGSEMLLSAIDQLLSMSGLDKKDLEGICVTQGPGSFTSMRISLAIAESLGLGLNIPLYGVDALTLMAKTVPYYSGTIKVIRNAYKGEFYVASFCYKKGILHRMSEIELVTPRAFYEKLVEGELVLGDGLIKLEGDGFDLNQKKVNRNKDFARQITGIHVVEYFLNETNRAPSVVPLEPIYIRLSEAEINYDKQFQKR